MDAVGANIALCILQGPSSLLSACASECTASICIRFHRHRRAYYPRLKVGLAGQAALLLVCTVPQVVVGSLFHPPTDGLVFPLVDQRLAGTQRNMAEGERGTKRSEKEEDQKKEWFGLVHRTIHAGGEWKNKEWE